MNTVNKGKRGEAIAWKLLAQKGFKRLHQNYRYKRAEVDLIVGKGNLVVFVEVKMRNSTAYGYPEAGISKAQQQRIRRAATHYQYQLSPATNIRFDVVAILKIGNKTIAKHLEDAF